MSYWRAVKIFVRPSQAPDAWTRIEANVTVAAWNLGATAVVLFIILALTLADRAR